MKENMQKQMVMIVIAILFTLTIVGTVAAADNSTHNRTVDNISMNDSGNLSTNFTHQNNQTLPDPQIEHNGVNSTSYSTIQDAINDAQNGDTIWLENGATFYEHLNINKDLIFKVASNGQATIDGSNTGIIYIGSGVTVALYNLIITNGKSNGGAIANYGTLTVNNCTFINNTATTDYGGGAIFNRGTLNITGSTFINNTATTIYGGGAIYNDPNCNCIVNNSTFTGNNATYGGAIFNYGTFSINGSTFIGNNASGIRGSGGAIENSGTLTITNSTFTGNTGTTGSGAIDNYHATCTVTGSTFTGNTAPGNTGGAIWNNDLGTLTANFNTFIGNTASQGYDICNSGSSFNVEYNWWGSNSGPASGSISGAFNPIKWLVLTLTANPTTINNGETSTIIADLLHDSGILSDPTHPELYYHNPALGHVPDGTHVNFSFQGAPLGMLSTNTAYTNNGAATTTFTANTAGTSHVLAAVDSQTVGPVNIQINPAADISLSKEFRDTDGNVITTAHYNDRIVTIIKVHNYGPDAATNVEISDTLPSGLTPLFYAVSYNGGTTWNYMGSYSGVWNIANIPSGAEYWIGISTNVTSTGTKTNIATVTHLDQYDPTTPDTASATLTVNPAPTSLSVNSPSGYNGDTVDITTTLTDMAHNVPVVGKQVIITVNGHYYSASTDNNGQITWQFPISNMDANSYTIQASFADDNVYDSSVNTGTLTVNAIPTSLTVNPASGYKGYSTTLSATLLDAAHSNAGISGKTVTFKVKGVTVGTGITGANGVATCIYNPITQDVGSYPGYITAVFAGDTQYAGVTSSGSTLTVDKTPTTLSVNDVTGNKGHSVDLKATLKDYYGNPVSGKTIIFKVNGVAVPGSATADASGVATLPYYVDLVGGTYTVSAEFAADDQYLGSTCEGVLKVPQSGVYVLTTVSQNSPTVGDIIKITFKLGNKGPDGAENVIFTYVIPDGLKLVDIDGDGIYSYDKATRTITWNLGDVPANTDPYLYVLVKPLNAGTFDINPDVSTITYDPDLSNNVQFTAFSAAKPNVVKPKVNAASKTRTIPLQHTGLPLAGFIFGMLAVFGGLASKRKN